MPLFFSWRTHRLTSLQQPEKQIQDEKGDANAPVTEKGGESLPQDQHAAKTEKNSGVRDGPCEWFFACVQVLGACCLICAECAK
jgi:hypothetical protein